MQQVCVSSQSSSSMSQMYMLLDACCTGGMERPTDTYKRTHNMVLKPRDSTFGGQVSRLQVAELVTACVANPELAENKCLEVVAETTAKQVAYEQLLTSIAAELTKVGVG